MPHSRARAVLLAATIAAQVTALPSQHYDGFGPVVKSRNNGVKWGPCSDDLIAVATAPIECGTLLVPLDYTLANSSALPLNLVKVSAPDGPAEHSILFNPGGPGVRGMTSVAKNAKSYLENTGGIHNLIGFDPRGTGDTIPFSCFATDEERGLITQLYPTITLPTDSETALGKVFAHSKILSDTCAISGQDIGSLLGTAYVARDIMHIVDTLEDDGLLRFWGFSYGTVLGATIAAMFPDRIDRLVLDGVVNAHDYYHNPGQDVMAPVNSDRALTLVLAACTDAPESCPLTKIESDPGKLEQYIKAFLEDLRFNPIVHNFQLIDYTTVKTVLFMGIKNPSRDLLTNTQQLYDVMTGNYTGFINGFAPSDSGSNEALQGIKCSESVTRATEVEGIQDISDSLVESSYFGDLSVRLVAECSHWAFDAKEKYTGDFNVETRHPMLIVNNRYDPSTNVASAVAMSRVFKGSVFLEQDSVGHCSTSWPSKCVDEALRSYWVDGKLPDPGTVCEGEGTLY